MSPESNISPNNHIAQSYPISPKYKSNPKQPMSLKFSHISLANTKHHISPDTNKPKVLKLVKSALTKELKTTKWFGNVE